MRILDFYKPSFDHNVICLGKFDGMHLGHKSIIYKGLEVRSSLEYGTKLAAFCFQRTAEKGIFRHIYNFRETAYKFNDELVDNMIVAPETTQFFGLDKTYFLDVLRHNFSPVTIICGSDYTFGRNREGNVEYLKEYCSKFNIPLIVMPMFTLHGTKVSSSEIRKLLTEGNMLEAMHLLGENYFVRGKVVKGRGDGRKIGFPTINLEISPEKVPLKEGVYRTFTIVHGLHYRSITNYGSAPTFGSDKMLIETHLANFDEDIYGEEVKIDFKLYLREARKFNSVEELREQLEEDLHGI